MAGAPLTAAGFETLLVTARGRRTSLELKMRSGKPTNKELDGLGRRLLIASSPVDAEIDRIISDPRLYDGVLAKIAAAEASVRRQQAARFAWKPVAASAMVLALLSIPLLAYLKFANKAEPIARETHSAPQRRVEEPLPPRPLADEPQPYSEPKDSPARAAVPIKVPAPVDRIPRPRRERPAPVPQAERAFQPIGLAERAEDAAIDGRVVRVDVPRATLFAMGVDLPLENGTRSVKADLLLGPDGSPRAIRLVE